MTIDRERYKEPKLKDQFRYVDVNSHFLLDA